MKHFFGFRPFQDIQTKYVFLDSKETNISDQASEAWEEARKHSQAALERLRAWVTSITKSSDPPSVPEKNRPHQAQYLWSAPQIGRLPVAQVETSLEWLPSLGLETNNNGFISILLAGKDSPRRGRTDALQQVLIDPNTWRVALVSIPRDLATKDAHGNMQKLNTIIARDRSGKIPAAIAKEVTGQEVVYRAGITVEDFGGLQSTFESAFPQGFVLPFEEGFEVYRHDTKTGRIVPVMYEGKKLVFQPKEKITDINQLLFLLRMRYGYRRSPKGERRTLSSGDIGREQRQGQIVGAMIEQVPWNRITLLKIADEIQKLLKKENGEAVGLVDLFMFMKKIRSAHFKYFPPTGIKNHPSPDGVHPYYTIGIDVPGLRQELQNYFQPK